MIKISSKVFVENEGVWVIEATVELVDGTRGQAYIIPGDSDTKDEVFLDYIKSVWNIE